MNKIYEAPEIDNTQDNIGRRIFLAGTIDMGNSYNWQSSLINKILDHPDLDITIYNPRRSNFDGCDQNEQINWELDHLDKSDIILMRLLPDSSSPISLMELGLYAKSGKLIVVCPKEFYRYNNVRIVCERNNIPLYNSPNEVVINKLLNK